MSTTSESSSQPLNPNNLQSSLNGNHKRFMSPSTISGDYDDDDDENSQTGTTGRAKRPKSNSAASAKSTGGAGSGGGGPVSSSEKEARKAARMIRNRNAAQASRDRKKEHTQLLEARVAELEAQLYFASAPAPGGAPPPPISRPRSSSTSHSDGHLLALQDENERLRTELQYEQMESNRLRDRLEVLEDKFNQFSSLLGSSSTPSSPATSVSSMNLEPTFTFETIPLVPTPLLPTPLDPTSKADPTEKDKEKDDKEPNDSRLVAAEVVRSLSPPLPPSTSLDPSSSLDELTINDVWGDWAQSVEIKKEEVDEQEEEDLSMEYLDFTYLLDAPSLVC